MLSMLVLVHVCALDVNDIFVWVPVLTAVGWVGVHEDSSRCICLFLNVSVFFYSRQDMEQTNLP